MKSGTEPASDAQRRTRRRRIIGAVAGSALALAAVLVATAWMPDRRPAAQGEPSSTSSPTIVVPGPSPDGTPVDGSEVLPPEGDSSLDGVPLMTPEAPLVEGPLPESDAADGRLVTGFPVDLAGPLTDDTVVESSVTSEGNTMQAALIARSDRTPKAVRALFEDRWSALGLVAEQGSSDDLTYRGSSAAVTVTATESGTGTVYTVFAVAEAG